MEQPKEFIYRRFLAENLNLIESGLTLIKEEYALDNALGSRGYIDILCRDKYGHIVVIEVKRSKQASRQALHELTKYIALLKSYKNLFPEQIRCILISTNWDELLVPFSEYCNATSYQITGYKIDYFDGDNKKINISTVHPIKINTNKKDFFPQHMMYLYEQDTNDKALLKAIKTSGIEGGVVISLSYKGCDKRVIYPYCHNLVITKLSDNDCQKLLEQYDCDMDSIEESILGALNYNLYDTIEIGYPEKLLNALENDWYIDALSPFGNFEGVSDLTTDEELIKDICGISGQHAHLYFSISNPLHSLSWQNFVTKSQRSIYGNSEWEAITESVFSFINKDFKNADVSLYVYNPQNILFSIYKYAQNAISSYFPYMEFIISSNEKSISFILRSFLIHANEINCNLSDLVRTYYYDTFDYLLAIHEHNTWMHDNGFINGLGLKYCHFLTKVEHNQTVTSEVDSKLNMIKSNVNNYK